MRPFSTLSLVCLAAQLVTLTARADDNKLAAEALFAEGRKLVLQERYAEAIEKFEASQKLDPGIGTLMNLGRCFEKTGKTASAWLRFREAVTLARRRGEVTHETEASKHVAELEPRLCKLTINGDKTATISRDQSAVAPELLGIAVPVDPGEHSIEAIKLGYESWRTKTVVNEGKQPCSITVDIPELKPKPAVVTKDPIVPPPLSPAPPDFGAQRTASVLVGASGVVALGFATGFAIAAKNQYDTAKAGCSASGGCTPEQRADQESAGGKADVATGLLVGGGVAMAASVVLWLTAPKARAASRSFVIVPGVDVAGRGTTLSIHSQFTF